MTFNTVCKTIYSIHYTIAESRKHTALRITIAHSNHCALSAHMMYTAFLQLVLFVASCEAGFLPICQNQIQGLLKDFQGELN